MVACAHPQERRACRLHYCDRSSRYLSRCLHLCNFFWARLCFFSLVAYCRGSVSVEGSLLFLVRRTGSGKGQSPHGGRSEVSGDGSCACLGGRDFVLLDQELQVINQSYHHWASAAPFLVFGIRFSPFRLLDLAVRSSCFCPPEVVRHQQRRRQLQQLKKNKKPRRRKKRVKGES